MTLLDANVLLYAVNQVRDRLAAPAATVVAPGPRHLDLLAELLAGAGTAATSPTTPTSRRWRPNIAARW